MGRGVNKAIIVGNFGRNPEVRYSANGVAVANVSIATTETWKDKDSGESNERTEWHRVIFFGRLAEIVGEYLKKGSQVYVEGRLQTRKWQDQSGRDRYTTEIVASDMQMLWTRNGTGSRPAADKDPPPAHKDAAGDGSTVAASDLDDDIPF